MDGSNAKGDPVRRRFQGKKPVTDFLNIKNNDLKLFWTIFGRYIIAFGYLPFSIDFMMCPIRLSQLRSLMIYDRDLSLLTSLNL